MNELDQRKAAKEFADRWKGKGNEEQDKHDYWKELLSEVFGINKHGYLKFEKPVKVAVPLTVEEARAGKKPKTTTKFIDVYIPSVNVLIEQKGIKYSLDMPEQRGDLKLTPLEQAKLYNNGLLHHERARWIITSNFKTIRVYDTSASLIDYATEIQLEELPDRFHELNFLIDASIQKIRKEEKVSEEAGKLVGKLYDSLKKMYTDPDSPETLHGLNVLMVRLVFLLYAEDAELLQNHYAFGDFCKSYKPENLRSGLKDLFRILDTKEADRDPDEPEKLLAFPYINGGLFNDNQKAKFPKEFSEEAYNILVDEMSYGMDWKEISPTIFGMVFESTLDSKMRHAGGMHYTSLENIHKILDNLFLNDLQAEFEKILAIKSKSQKNTAIDAFREKLSKIHILDPAAGSGNFLTESYLSLRKLENEAIKERYNSEMFLGGLENPIKVSIQQMHGIEINDFAVSVAKTALWIAEAQMYEATKEYVNINQSFLPLHSNSKIIEGNALQLDWNSLCSRYSLSYIIGNPPFLGARWMNKDQKADMINTFGNISGVGNLDYVTAWYKKAMEFIDGTNIKVAFVSTNSISQGEQANLLWKFLQKYHPVITFAYRTFPWESESKDMAAVHVIIIAFTQNNFSYTRINQFIFDQDNKKIECNQINQYLLPAPLILLDRRTKPICKDIPPMIFGSMANDGGNLLLNQKEKDQLIQAEPESSKFIRPFTMGKEFLHNIPRYCLWLKDVPPSEYAKCKAIKNRIEQVKIKRSQSDRISTKKLAETPMLFGEIRQPESDYIAVPAVSSENRKYIPIGYLEKNIIAGNKIFIIPNGTLYHFGILISNVHNAWMRTVAGRLEMRYNYSNTIVYNNFPWPVPTDQQRQKIEATAKAILDARANYPESSLADLYDPLLMPADLRKAHQANDKAVMEAYGFWKTVNTEAECVAKLFEMYQELTKDK